jgi:hypothetical protein
VGLDDLWGARADEQVPVPYASLDHGVIFLEGIGISCRAETGHGQIVALVGEPGVGHSRLFHEFALRSMRRASLALLDAAIDDSPWQALDPPGGDSVRWIPSSECSWARAKFQPLLLVVETCTGSIARPGPIRHAGGESLPAGRPKGCRQALRDWYALLA